MNARVFRVLGVVAAAAAILAVSGCGGDGATAAQARPSGDQRAAFTECLRKNGVTPPTGRPSGFPTARPSGSPSPRPSRGAGGFGTMNPKMREAMRACAALRGGGGRAFGGRGGQDDSAMRAFRTCMADNGAELPEGGGLRALRTTDPEISKALAKCRPLLPARGAGRPTPGA
ncbi:MAG TPA: hypothetical protein VIR33_11340 [Thermopolyspora sp.]